MSQGCASEGERGGHRRWWMHFAAAAVIVVATTACTTPQVAPDHVSGVDGGGVVVFSVSHDEEGGSASAAIVYLDGGIFGGANGSLFQSYRKGFAGFGSEDSDYEDVEGHLYVISLPPGEHAFTGWQVASNGKRFTPRQEPPMQRFRVVAGEVSYLGNFHGVLFRGKNFLGITLTGQAVVAVTDQRTRDLALLAKRYPQYRTKVKAEPLTFLGPWIQRGSNGAVNGVLDPLPQPKPH